ncbi:MAG: histidine kinase [Dokdonella sp.]|nr:histidine kinase [Dokdonella sp.]
MAPRAKPPESNPSATWMPTFCSAPTLFVLMLVGELVALVIVLAPQESPREWLPRLGTTTVYVQWLVLLNAVVLCSLRKSLQNLISFAGFLLAWSTAVVVTALASWVVCRIDQSLDAGFTVPARETLRFVFANAAICALIAAAVLRYLFVFEQWRERMRAASKAQVEALQARIRPHFLFNSMNTIASLIRNRPADAERTVEDLAELFRAALGPDDAPATLGEELDLIERYLAIERLRLGERLRLDIDVAALPRDLPLPRLLLQPLVENAIYHGIQPRAEGGTLSIHGQRAHGEVEIVFANPLPQGASARRNGMALANVRARIGYHFGTHGELRVEPQADQFIVRVRLPENGVQ